MLGVSQKWWSVVIYLFGGTMFPQAASSTSTSSTHFSPLPLVVLWWSPVKGRVCIFVGGVTQLSMSLAKWKVRLQKGGNGCLCYQELGTKSGYPLLMSALKIGFAHLVVCTRKKNTSVCNKIGKGMQTVPITFQLQWSCFQLSAYFGRRRMQRPTEGFSIGWLKEYYEIRKEKNAGIILNE